MNSEATPTRWAIERSEQQRRDYAKRFERIAAKGEDVHGEARFVDALASRGSAILDAGCGAGRLAAYLHSCGHDAVGIDADPLLIAAGRATHPHLRLATLDLTTISPTTLQSARLPTSYDVIVAAGNVMVYVAPGTEALVIERLNAVLKPGGRAVFGFHTDRDYTHDHLDEATRLVGWTREFRFGTWQCEPYSAASDWATSVYRSPS